jgi:hypothetical protein
MFSTYFPTFASLLGFVWLISRAFGNPGYMGVDKCWLVQDYMGVKCGLKHQAKKSCYMHLLVYINTSLATKTFASRCRVSFYWLLGMVIMGR